MLVDGYDKLFLIFFKPCNLWRGCLADNDFEALLPGGRDNSRPYKARSYFLTTKNAAALPRNTFINN